MFDHVHALVDPDDSLDGWVQRVQRFVQDGGSVRMACPPSPLTWARQLFFGETPSEATTDPVERVLRRLTELGYTAECGEFEDSAEVARPLLLPRSRSSVQVSALLRRASSVLWADGVHGEGAVGLWASGDPRRVFRAVQRVQSHGQIGPLHVFIPRSDIDDVRQAREVLGIDLEGTLHPVDGRGPSLLAGLRSAMQAEHISLLAVAVSTEGIRTPVLSVLGALEADLWVLPELEPPAQPGMLDAYDAVVIGDVVRMCLVRSVGPMVWTPDDTTLHVVRAGVVEDAVDLRGGRVAWPAPVAGDCGLCTDAADPILSLVARVRVLEKAGRPVVLVSWPPPDTVASWQESHRVWACPPEQLQPELLRDEGRVDAVLHADSVLDRGTATDIPLAARDLTLARIARLLRREGYLVAGHLSSETGQFIAAPVELPSSASLGDTLQTQCSAVPTWVTQPRWLLDGREAREHLLALVGSAQRQIDLQVYIFEVDSVGRAVGDALYSAADRGVSVRVLVDALWSAHGALARNNPILSHLAAHPNVVVRSSRPVAQILDLKARDHRKLVVVDGEVALLPGRNIGEHYYTGFDEVRLTPLTDQRQVPWFDLSVEVRGPVVHCAAWSFAGAWSEAHGETFELPPPLSTSETNAWWVPHTGLADTNGLDAMRILLRVARHSVVVVNTFALHHELQHALMACLARGVAVRIYTGHVRPRFDGGRQPFPGSPERDLATGVIHGRFDPLVEAGADAFALSMRQADWDPQLGSVLPHVHSKLMVVDDRYVVAGSHNIDIASAYWESEIMLVMDAPTEAARLNQWLRAQESDALSFAKTPAGVPEWRQQTLQPLWLSQHWPSLLS